jgi:hypothetical protein
VAYETSTGRLLLTIERLEQETNRLRELLTGFTDPPRVALADDGRITVTVTADHWRQATAHVLATRAHDDPDDGTLVTLEHTTTRLRVHPPDRCAGQHCTVHNRSDHHMRHYPQHWRADRGIMERTCPHGVGHPDPDSPHPPDSHEWVHGCDGCCTPPKDTP